MEVLDDEQRAFLRKYPYHYNAWSQSLLDRWMQPFWRSLIKFVPKKATASSITALGLTASLASSAITLYKCPNFGQEAPSWLFVLNAVSLWFYQTMDAVDGKQSYKTQCCELEEFTDHAADSLSTICMAFMLAASLQMHTYFPELLIPLFTLCMVALYTTHSVSYFTHSCVFELFDVTEVQYVAISISLIAAWKGQSFWAEELANVAGYSISAGLLMILASGFGFVNKTVQNVLIVRGAQTPLEIVGIRIPRRKPSMGPYWLLLWQLVLVMNNYPKALANPVPFMLIHGVAIARSSCKLVITSMTRGNMPSQDLSLMAPALSILPEVSARYGWNFVNIDLDTFYTVCVAIALIDHGAYCTAAIRGICEGRDIWTFSLKHGEPKVIDEGFYLAGADPASIDTAVKRWNKWKADPANKEALAKLYG